MTSVRRNSVNDSNKFNTLRSNHGAYSISSKYTELAPLTHEPSPCQLDAYVKGVALVKSPLQKAANSAILSVGDHG
jgi:hypothetical protein